MRVCGRHVPMQCDGEPWRQAPATITVCAAPALPRATLLAENERAASELRGGAHSATYDSAQIKFTLGKQEL
jgi:hypothetical protein